MTIKEEKAAFLANDVNAFAAALKRNKIYAKGKATPANRQKLREALDKCVDDILKRHDYKNGKVGGDKHCTNIAELSRAIAAKCGGFLHRKKFRIGAAQKFLNIRLKQLWCEGKIKTPPHCPFDRVVIDALPKRVLKGAVVNWTETDKIKDYKAWVAAFESDRDNMLGALVLPVKDEKLAAWELYYWNLPPKRRNALIRKYNKARRKAAQRGE